MMRTRTWQRISRSLSLIAATALLAGCSTTQMEPSGAQSSRWPEAQQEVNTKTKAASLPQSEPEGAAGADEANPKPDTEGLCESIGKPALLTYLSDRPDGEWLADMEEFAVPGTVDLTKRPIADELEWIGQMPGEAQEEVWCEAKTVHNMWLIGIAWPNGQPEVVMLQASDHARAY